jgi:hypothetical protein
MFRVLFFLLSFIGLVSSAQATTYIYTGGPGLLTSSGTDASCDFVPCAVPSFIGGQISFSGNTNHFTGTLGLSPGDVGSMEGPAAAFFYPVQDPGLTYGLYSSLSGSFTFENGKIVSWYMSGQASIQNCGGGPGCHFGSGFTSTPTFETAFVSAYFSNYNYEGAGGGAWKMIASPVPEISTWIMLLLGFASTWIIPVRERLFEALLVVGQIDKQEILRCRLQNG